MTTQPDDLDDIVARRLKRFELEWAAYLVGRVREILDQKKHLIEIDPGCERRGEWAALTLEQEPLDLGWIYDVTEWPFAQPIVEQAPGRGAGGHNRLPTDHCPDPCPSDIRSPTGGSCRAGGPRVVPRCR